MLSALLLSSCKKEKKNFPINMQIRITELSGSTLVLMDITDQNGKNVFTTKDQKQIDLPYGTQDVYSGDVLTVHYSSNKPYSAQLGTGSARIVFTRDNVKLSEVVGDLGYTTGKTIMINIP